MPNHSLPYSHLETLGRAFCDLSLPKRDWTHEAHLRVGLWYLLQFTPQEALERLRTGIRRYNVATGVPNTDSGGYHETVTRFYVVMIAGFLERVDRTKSADELAEELIGELGDRKLPLRYWSKERFDSHEARRGWLEPDLQPLDCEPHQ